MNIISKLMARYIRPQLNTGYLRNVSSHQIYFMVQDKLFNWESNDVMPSFQALLKHLYNVHLSVITVI